MKSHPSRSEHVEGLHADRQSRRRFLTDVAFGAAGLGGAGVISLGSGLKTLAAEPPPETTKIRLFENPVTCFAPHGSPGRTPT